MCLDLLDEMADNKETVLKRKFEELSARIVEIARMGTEEWQSVVEEIGIGGDSLNQWTEIYESQVSELFRAMSEEVIGMKADIQEDLQALLQEAQSLCVQLNKRMPQYGSHGYSLKKEKEILEKQIEMYQLELNEKLEEVEALRKKQRHLCTTLEKSERPLPTNPLPSKEILMDFNNYLENLEQEKFNREEKYFQMKVKMTNLVEDIRYKPALDFEKVVLCEDESKFMVTDTNMKLLEAMHQSLLQRSNDIKEGIIEHQEKVRQYWSIIEEDVQYCNTFFETHSGYNIDTLEALKLEVQRCDAIKKANIKIYIEKYRDELQVLWTKAFYSEEDKRHFRYFDSDVYTEDLLSIHDLELQKIKSYLAENKEFFALVEIRNDLWKKFHELEHRATAPERYKNRRGQLLKEEKERNGVLKQIPSVETQLTTLAEKYCNKHGHPICIMGETIDKIISKEYHELEEVRKLKISTRKQEATPKVIKSFMGISGAASVLNLQRITPQALQATPVAKRKPDTPLVRTESKIPKRTLLGVSRTAPVKPTFKAGPRYRISMERRKRLKKCLRNSKAPEQKENHSSDYEEFRRDVSNKDARSTGVPPIDSPLAVPLADVENVMQKTPRRI